MRTEYFWEGAMLSIANARDLFEAAEESAKRGRFGIATSLAILSAEECTKSYALLARAVSGSTEEIQLKAYFTSHKAKHEMGSAMLTLFRLVGHIHSIASEVALDNSVVNAEKDSHFLRQLSEWSAAEVSGRENIAGDIAVWKMDADRAKQRGLYVDSIEGGWHSPTYVCESEYIFRKNYALEFLDILDTIVAQGSLGELRQAFDRAKTSTKRP